MIFVMSEKRFMKNKKKLVEPKDYIILDATESENGDLKKFTSVLTVDGFNPPPKLVNELAKDKDVEIEIFKLEKLEKKFFKGKEFTISCMGAVKSLVDANRSFNVFIVMKNKAYKQLGSKVVKKIKKLFDVDFNFVYSYEELKDNKKSLKKDLSEDQIHKLNKKLKKLEEKLREDELGEKKEKKKKK